MWDKLNNHMASEANVLLLLLLFLLALYCVGSCVVSEHRLYDMIWQLAQEIVCFDMGETGNPHDNNSMELALELVCRRLLAISRETFVLLSVANVRASRVPNTIFNNRRTHILESFMR